LSQGRRRTRETEPDTGEETQQHLTTAAAMYREMDMHFWLEQAQAPLKQVGAPVGEACLTTGPSSARESDRECGAPGAPSHDVFMIRPTGLSRPLPYSGSDETRLRVLKDRSNTIEGMEGHMSIEGILLQPGGAQGASLRGTQVDFLVTAEHAKGCSVFEFSVAPGFDTGAHYHTKIEEIFLRP
jgi:hypothetical protein